MPIERLTVTEAVPPRRLLANLDDGSETVLEA